MIKKNNHVLTPEEAAEEFNDFFLAKIKKIKEGILPFTGDRLKGARRKAERLGLKPNAFHFRTVTEKEVMKAIHKSKSSKCPDINGISPAVMKIAPNVLAVPLTFIINQAISTGEVPRCWKVARVLPLHKKNSKESAANYRPVSILPSPSKILEEVLRGQMTKYLEEKKILPATQFGFRSGRSTIQATGAALHDWQRARREELVCGALQFDLSAAFDMLSPDLLVKKLQIYGAGTDATGLVLSYLSGRRQRVDYGNMSSEVRDVVVGSPQGSCLSPLLYITLVADMDEWLEKVNVVAYADDSSVYAIASSRQEVRHVLERAAEEILVYFRATSLAANATKTKFVMFGRSAEKPPKIGETEIEESEAEELLGFTYNKSLNWKHHLSKLESELRKRTGIIRRMAWHLLEDRGSNELTLN